VIIFGNDLPVGFLELVVGKMGGMPLDMVQICRIPVVFFAEVFVVVSFGGSIAKIGLQLSYEGALGDLQMWVTGR